MVYALTKYFFDGVAVARMSDLELFDDGQVVITQPGRHPMDPA